MKFDGPLLEGRWRLGPRVGRGAQAHTFLARDEKARDERVVVLKQFHLEKSTWKKFDLYEREVAVLKKLRHPHIPRFLSAFESEPGVFNLVIERMPGATLRAIATKVRFTDGELRDIIERVLDILDHIHTRNPPVIHRDIKPANLIRDAKGNLALVDFGGVRHALREEGGSTVVGTFGYMAPEQLHGQATPATDIYGLGATIVALAGGVEPEDVPRQGLRMDLSAHLAGRDAGLISVLEVMTAPDPDKRPSRARTVRTLLREQMRAAPKSISRLPVPTGAQQVLASDEPKPFEELSELIDEVPQPVEALLRILLVIFAVGGFAAVTVVKAALLPLIFGVLSLMSDSNGKAKLNAAKRDARQALGESQEGLRRLRKTCLNRGGDPPARLPGAQ
ncbi:serine/threonine protein kinase [Haliangium ochraceum]|uniref:non-specific serine/threonine protein kinase n=1 Tax=Haliangium ochraceum (strain DSM 14365 / JCM 11303 / SMP-2) TaxID=502025 RepID=D0LP31_HALO1|nr:serine/threonine-protein kinase [Haliangium ochraceum]ACY18857.1 serine/threonine protein kinase [Haliangium ochraceum DSM 14365]